MQNTVLHLKTKESFHQCRDIERSETIITAFIEACSKLNAGIFEPFMNEDDCFEDKGKYEFLSALQKKLKHHRKRVGNTFIVSVEDTVCNGCSYGKPVKSFYFYSSDEEKNSTKGTAKFSKGFGYLIDIQDGILKDIYECNGLILSLLKNEPSHLSTISPEDGAPF
jgi:hypothetical protein